jgi:N-acylneuraminate cytidylyltransferase
LYWNLQAAMQVDQIERIVIATEDAEIAKIATDLGDGRVVVYPRSAESASDTSSTEQVLLEYLNTAEHDSQDRIILMQVTSPFTESEDLKRGLLQLDNGFDSVLSVVPFKRFLWKQTDGVAEAQNYHYEARPRRQDMEATGMENGAFYIQTVCGIIKNGNRLGGKIGLVEMPEYSGVEIDEPADWILAEALFRQYHASRIKNTLSTANIRLVLSDVDGVLTDAGMYYSAEGDIMKRFNTRDGMGFNLLQEAGIKVGIITSENTEIVAKRAEKLKLDFVRQGHRFGGKLEAAKEICDTMGITLKEVAYIGDDVNCKALLEQVGFAACPADASDAILGISGIHVLEKRGGEGCFRELAELVLQK